MANETQSGEGRERRQQRRVEVGIPIVVMGTDREGVEFKEGVQSFDVSRTGASFSTTRQLEEGMEVDIIIPRAGGPRSQENDFVGKARVVRVRPGGNPRERVVGVNFQGPRFHRVFVSEST